MTDDGPNCCAACESLKGRIIKLEASLDRASRLAVSVFDEKKKLEDRVWALRMKLRRAGFRGQGL